MAQYVAMAHVQLVRVSKTYPEGKRAALQPLELAISDGELLVLLGPSGCGKSTTLRLIAGLEEPTEGDIMIDQTCVTHVPPAHRDVAMVFQNYALYPHMTVYDNLAFALRMRKLPTADMNQKVRDTALLLGLEDLLARRPKQLSGGQRQRVAIGRAMVRQPKVFLFDEPLSNLDPGLRADIRREIARLQKQTHTTTVYVTHDQLEAMSLADRLVVLRDGVVQQVGTPMELYSQPANLFVAQFLGTPTMNMIHGSLAPTLSQSTWDLTVGSVTTTLPTSPAKPPTQSAVMLGIRPQHLSLTPNGADLHLPARVMAREFCGQEAHWQMQTPVGDLTLVTDAHVDGKAGDMMAVYLAPHKFHLFDLATEIRL